MKYNHRFSETLLQEGSGELLTDSPPGTAGRLLTEETVTFIPRLEERVDRREGKRLFVRGPAQRLEHRNQNGRIYPRSVFERNLSESSQFQERLRNRQVLGELEHPENGNTALNRVSHIVVGATIEDLAEGNQYGVETGTYVITECMVLETPMGKILKELLERGVPVGISSRGRGDTIQNGEDEIVQDNYELDTWDYVYRPSVREARHTIETSRTEGLMEQDPNAPAATSPAAAPSQAPTGGVELPTAPPEGTPEPGGDQTAEAPNVLAQANELVKGLEEIIVSSDNLKDFSDGITNAIDILNQLVNAEDPEATKVRDQILSSLRMLALKASDIMNKKGGGKKKSSSNGDKKKDDKEEKEKAESVVLEAGALVEKINTFIHEGGMEDLARRVSERRDRGRGKVFRGEIENILNRAGHEPDEDKVGQLASALRQRGLDVDDREYGDLPTGESTPPSGGNVMAGTGKGTATAADVASSLAGRLSEAQETIKRQKAQIARLRSSRRGTVASNKFEAAVDLCCGLAERNQALQIELAESQNFGETATAMLHGMKKRFESLGGGKSPKNPIRESRRKRKPLRPLQEADLDPASRKKLQEEAGRSGDEDEGLNESSQYLLGAVDRRMGRAPIQEKKEN